jgi:uncharacterized protein YukE
LSTPRPPDFEPLASSDPVPGDTSEIAALGKRYTDTAAEIETQAANLRKLAAASPQGWKGQAGTVFASKASGLADRISKAHARYATAGGALTACAEPMEEAQQRAYAAVWQAKDAQQQMTANAPGPPRPPGAPPLTQEQQTAEQSRQTAYGDAQTSLSQARTKFTDAVSDYHSSAAAAARKITNELGSDSLTDSWWDRNFGWISKVFEFIAIAVIVLAIIALIIACPFTAGLLLWLGVSAEVIATIGTIGTAIGWVLFGLTVLQAVYDGVAWQTGKESSTAFWLDIVALCTFGFGKGAEALAEGLAGGAEGTAKVIAASRAGSEAMKANGLPGFLYSLSKFGPAEWVMRLVPGVGDALDAAGKAAGDASSAVEAAVKAAKASNIATFMTMSGDMGKTLAKINAIADEVPGSLRIGVSVALAKGLAAVDGVLQWGAFLSGGVFTLHGILAGG